MLITKIYNRGRGYLHRIGFELLNWSLRNLPAGLYFTKYPVTHYFSLVQVQDPGLRKLAGGLDSLKVAADACYKALGWQKEASLEALIARGIEKQGHIEGLGWIHTKLAELAREQSIESFCLESLSIRQLCSRLLDDRLVLASVNLGFQPSGGKGKGRRGGHFVIVYGFCWEKNDCTGFYVLDLAGDSTGERFVPAQVFRQAFSGRAIFMSIPRRRLLPEEQPLAWVEVDLSSIARNVQGIKRFVGPQVELAAVMKANAYGHGAERVARVLAGSGVSLMAVATLEEAIRLRRHGIESPILVLYGVPAWEADIVLAHDLEIAVFDEELPRALAAAARRRGTKVNLHINVDTGMGWCGLSFEEPRLLKLAAEIQRSPQLNLEGIFSHFANSDGDSVYTRRQLERFLSVVEALEREGIRIPCRHISNSAAVLNCPEASLDMVRPGLILYGLYPHPAEPAARELTLEPALQYKTRIIQIRNLAAGEAIGYGSTYVVNRPSTIAVLPVGYFDGVPRSLSNKGSVLIKGRRAPIVGTVCMNMLIIDVTGVPGAAKGDEAVLIGRQGDNFIGVEEVAGIVGTISYEIVTRIPEHIPRKYVSSSKGHLDSG